MKASNSKYNVTVNYKTDGERERTLIVSRKLAGIISRAESTAAMRA